MFQSQPTPFDRPANERPLIKLVLHSDSLRQRLLTGDPHVSTLLALRDFDFIELLITPTTDPEVLAYLSQHQLQCANVERSANHWALVEPTRRRLICWAQASIDYSAPVVSGSHVTWLDFFLGQHRDYDYFVVSPEDQFFSSNLRKEHALDPQEALNRVRILAVNSGLFYVQANFNFTVNEGYYYLYRFKKVFRSFQKAYTTAIFSGKVPVNACKQLDSLAQRLELICRAADHASYFALRRADNDNQDSALYHTAFLIMLITGVFDDLAWFIAHMYSIEVHRQKVSLRKQTNRANWPFFSALNAKNPSLKTFLSLPKTQAQLNLFYPVRDKLQHGVFLETIHFVLEQSNKNLLIIPKDSVKWMKELDGTTTQGEWGLVPSAVGVCIDPYRLATKAVAITASIVNEVLDLFDWEQVISDLPPELQNGIRENWAKFNSGVGKYLGWETEPVYF